MSLTTVAKPMRTLTDTEKLVVRLAQQDLALNSMVQGLAMFDAELRIVMTNAQYAQMYGLTSEQVRPGTPLRENIAHNIAQGIYVGTTADEVMSRMRKRAARDKVSYMTSTMGDGRTIIVSIQPGLDGGLVSTHTDITEREKLRTSLDAALNNMVQGLAMFDAENRIIIANQRYADMYGLTLEQVKPGTTLRQVLEYRIANGHHAKRSVDDMLKSMLSRTAREGSHHYLSNLRRWAVCHHARGHHRKAEVGSQNRPHGAARRADGLGKPGKA